MIFLASKLLLASWVTSIRLCVPRFLVFLGDLRKAGALLGRLLEQILSIVGSPDLVEGET
jgi:hypothetical protein